MSNDYPEFPATASAPSPPQANIHPQTDLASIATFNSDSMQVAADILSEHGFEGIAESLRRLAKAPNKIAPVEIGIGNVLPARISESTGRRSRYGSNLPVGHGDYWDIPQVLVDSIELQHDIDSAYGYGYGSQQMRDSLQGLIVDLRLLSSGAIEYARELQQEKNL